MRKIGMLYDMIWVYGPPDFYDPLTGLDVPANVRAKMKFVGFLQRSLSKVEEPDHRPKGDYLLVTTGGGGDGADLIHQVIHAYQQDPEPRPSRPDRARALYAGQEAAQADAQGRRASRSSR